MESLNKISQAQKGSSDAKKSQLYDKREEIIKRWNNVDIFDMLFGEKEVENKCAGKKLALQRTWSVNVKAEMVRKEQ